MIRLRAGRKFDNSITTGSRISMIAIFIPRTTTFKHDFRTTQRKHKLGSFEEDSKIRRSRGSPSKKNFHAEKRLDFSFGPCKTPTSEPTCSVELNKHAQIVPGARAHHLSLTSTPDCLASSLEADIFSTLGKVTLASVMLLMSVISLTALILLCILLSAARYADESCNFLVQLGKLLIIAPMYSLMEHLSDKAHNNLGHQH